MEVLTTIQILVILFLLVMFLALQIQISGLSRSVDEIRRVLENRPSGEPEPVEEESAT